MGGKKKGRRQVDPSRDECESTEDEAEEGDSLNSCPHTGKAVSLLNIKKTLKIAWVRVGQCASCLKEKKIGSKSMSGGVTRADIKALGGLPGGKTASLDGKKSALGSRASLDILSKPEPVKNIPAMTEPAPTEEAAVKAGNRNRIPCEDKAPVSIWLCLRCGSQACGSNVKDHSWAHVSQPRSDLHCLVLNTDSWVIWCYECKNEIYMDSHKKLYEAVEYVKKINELPNKQTAGRGNATAPAGPTFGVVNKAVFKERQQLSSSSSTAPTSATTAAASLPKVKGLTNLGNTCFFNSVMQCLSQTHPLTQLVDLQCPKGVNFNVKSLPPVGRPNYRLNGGTWSETEEGDDQEGEILLEDGEISFYAQNGESQLPDLNLQLAEGGPMLTSLAAFFKEMHAANKNGCVSPSHLFGQVVKQSPKFRGMQQQDSQELLRYLMDGLRSEEARRQKAAILKHFGLTEKTDQKLVARHVHRRLRAYGRNGSHTLFDKLFAGQTVSTIVCEECAYSSLMYEQFLDLSLPVVEDKPHKPAKKMSSPGQPLVLPDDEDVARVTCCGAQEGKKAKNQLKKEKLRKKKEARKGNKRQSATVDTIQVDSAISSPAPTSNGVKPPRLLKQPPPLFKLAKDAAANKEKKERPPRPEQRRTKDGNEEEEEEGYEEEEEEDWEWDYGETWEEEGNNGDDKEEEEDDDEEVDAEKLGSEYVGSDNDDKNYQQVNQEAGVHLGSQSANREGRIFQHERSSEHTSDFNEEEMETGASSNADIEDNNEVNDHDVRKRTLPLLPQNGTSHMETLRKQMDKLMMNSSLEDADKTLSADENAVVVAAESEPVPDGAQHQQSDNNSGAYQTAESELQEKGTYDKVEESSASKGVDMSQRRRSEWTARTLSSLAPRYQSKPGECSVYSCLNQFTQSELLTGSNRWACSNCARLKASRAAVASETDSSVTAIEPIGGGGEPTTQSLPKSSERAVYCNASKQFLIFCPPPILTLHLKRFHQTLAGPKKVTRHVEFPIELDLAPFCTATALALPNVRQGQSQILYSLYGVVEHSGRLHGGHYTAFIKVRAANTGGCDLSSFLSPPLSWTGDIPRLLCDLEQKMANAQRLPAPPEPAPRKWFHVSDSSVSETSEDKVLKAQAYLLFYERIL